MECVVCQDDFNADSKVPRVLSCGHTACAQCVKLMLIHSTGGTLVCVVCKLPHYALVVSPLQVPYNFALLDIMFAHVRGSTAMQGRGAGVMVVPGTRGGLQGFGSVVPGHGPALPGGAPPPLVAPHGRGGVVTEWPVGRARGGGPHGRGPPLPPRGPLLPTPLTPLEQIRAAAEDSPPPLSSSTSSSDYYDDEDEDVTLCPNRHRQLNAPTAIGNKFTVTLQQSPGMVWYGGQLMDGNKMTFAFNDPNQGSASTPSQGSGAEPFEDPDEDAIFDYVPILGPKTYR
ncbi:uncharacterized protein LOC135104406 [Scylla paramamosain]|uniref:uncharacterized protein LOC135104406 n=1 Tax=Scylla paramamosain TaxID=85552 RepID=UPI003082AA12